MIRCIDSMNGGEIFVPKIPSMRVTELGNALAPNCRREYIGIRTGEKLHEVLVSCDEARHGFEYDGMYVLYPGRADATGRKLPSGKPLMSGFSYTSDTNGQWLGREQFLAMIEGLV